MSADALADMADRKDAAYLERNQVVAALAGWKLVPIDPTEEMHAAAVRTITRCLGNDDFPPRVYRAMLAAAPDAPAAIASKAPPCMVDCGECPLISTGCKEGHCLKANTRDAKELDRG